MSSAGEPAAGARLSLQQANTSILSQSLASIPSPPAPFTAPPNHSTSNPPPHTASLNPTTSNQSTAQPQTEQTASTPAPPPPAHPQTQLANPLANTTTPARPPVQISQLPHRQHPTSWQPVAARIHHRDDDVRSYCAPGSNGWVEWQEQRVADSQAEIGRIDYSWDGGEIIDFAERKRLKELRRVRTAEWIGGLGEGHAEGEKKEGGRGGAEEKGEGGEEEKAKVGNREEMEIHEEVETDPETDSDTVKEKVWKRKARAVEQDPEDSCSSCLEAQGKKEEQEGDVLKECKRGQDDEDDDEVSQTGSDKYPEWVSRWKQVVMASRAQVGSPAYRAAEQRLSGTRLSYRRQGQI